MNVKKGSQEYSEYQGAKNIYVEILLSPAWHRFFLIFCDTERILLLQDTVPFFFNASLITQAIKHRPLGLNESSFMSFNEYYFWARHK
jgi:hypothetical protein